MSPQGTKIHSPLLNYIDANCIMHLGKIYSGNYWKIISSCGIKNERLRFVNISKTFTHIYNHDDVDKSLFFLYPTGVFIFSLHIFTFVSTTSTWHAYILSKSCCLYFQSIIRSLHARFVFRLHGRDTTMNCTPYTHDHL